MTIFHFVCRAEVNIAMEKRLQFRYGASATVQQLMSTCVLKEMTINTSTLFVESKLTSPRGSVSNFDAPLYKRLCQFRHHTDTDTDSTTHDWDREAAYENQQCSGWLAQYLRHSCSMQYRSRYNRTVCHLQRSG
jgi:hypothetical protein